MNIYFYAHPYTGTSFMCCFLQCSDDTFLPPAFIVVGGWCRRRRQSSADAFLSATKAPPPPPLPPSTSPLPTLSSALDQSLHSAYEKGPGFMLLKLDYRHPTSLPTPQQNPSVLSRLHLSEAFLNPHRPFSSLHYGYGVGSVDRSHRKK